MTPTLTQEEFVRLKRRLTFRQNRMKKAMAALKATPRPALKDVVVFEARQLVAEVDYAVNIFDEKGYPDAWARWERAKDDAQLQIRYNS